MENALILVHHMDNEAEWLCYNSRKALGYNIQITEERPNFLMCKKKKRRLARLSENKSPTGHFASSPGEADNAGEKSL